MSETARLTLTDFLLARIAEDEARFRRVEFELSYINLFDRLLAECEAKRRIVELRYSWNLQAERNPEPPFSSIFQTQVNTADAILRALALPYADHPDYRDEWQP
jgi:hypothetical protein